MNYRADGWRVVLVSDSGPLRTGESRCTTLTPVPLPTVVRAKVSRLLHELNSELTMPSGSLWRGGHQRKRN